MAVGMIDADTSRTDQVSVGPTQNMLHVTRLGKWEIIISCSVSFSGGLHVRAQFVEEQCIDWRALCCEKQLIIQ